MKVLQFAFYEADSEYLPHRHTENAVVYTGTHDNDTARGWYANLKPEERERVYDYLGVESGDEIHWALIRAAYASVAARAIAPMQDVLGLGSEARINTPAAPAGNWTWRAPDSAFRPEDAARLRRMAVLVGPVSCAIASFSTRGPSWLAARRVSRAKRGRRSAPRERARREGPGLRSSPHPGEPHAGAPDRAQVPDVALATVSPGRPAASRATRSRC